jgi:hypothetical protein
MAPGRPKHARVYLHREGSRLIVATVHTTQDGLLVEAEGPLSLTKWTDEDLGGSVTLALEQSTTVTQDLRKAKPADWPSLKVSGEPSIRSFQSRFIQIDLSGANEANLVTMIDGIPEGNAGLTIRTSVAFHASPVEYAQRITQVYHACRDRRF